VRLVFGLVLLLLLLLQQQLLLSCLLAGLGLGFDSFSFFCLILPFSIILPVARVVLAIAFPTPFCVTPPTL
jgi:hypothetical protein